MGRIPRSLCQAALTPEHPGDLFSAHPGPSGHLPAFKGLPWSRQRQLQPSRTSGLDDSCLEDKSDNSVIKLVDTPFPQGSLIWGILTDQSLFCLQVASHGGGHLEYPSAEQIPLLQLWSSVPSLASKALLPVWEGGHCSRARHPPAMTSGHGGVGSSDLMPDGLCCPALGATKTT